MKKAILLLGMSALLGGTAVSSAEIGTEVGVLSCDVSAGIGLIIEQKQTLNCNFNNGNNEIQNYTGSISEFGLELGEVKEAQMVWTVLAATSTVQPGALAGTYVGVDADASLGVGAGVKALVGGLDKSFTLQPLSVSTEKGTSLSLGVAALSLEYVK